ncbi:MAG: DUF5916 domain-containing protein [Thermoanaerobaculia bacterium]
MPRRTSAGGAEQSARDFAPAARPPRSTTRRATHGAAGIALLAAAAWGQASPPAAPAPATPPMDIRRAAGAIEVDGDLGDPGWKGAVSFDQFLETSPADNIPAKVKTVVWLAYDQRYFYVGIRADDPEPGQIRAPYVDRDQVIGTDDNIAVFLDTRNDHRAALELRVSPRGIQADGVYNDSNGAEDFAPDFFYDTAAKITAEGWQAEYRIPFSSLRYPKQDPQSWGILVWRNYPRDYRYAFHSAPIERGSNCLVCHAHEIRGLSGLPDTKHMVIAPYVNGKREGARSGGPETDFRYDDVAADGGVDFKWNPTAASALDATINPDFSQIESDTAQISANQRFALFYPEKRPFFLEGVDLFDTPIQAVYTRTITDPKWGVRTTGKSGDYGYTLLVTQDRGGGLVILPGPQGSSFAPQDFQSTVAIGRLKKDFGVSYAGLLYTGREIQGGGHNRVLGPDFQWRPSDLDAITGEVLWSDTQDPESIGGRPGESRTGHAAALGWGRNARRYDNYAKLTEISDGFRADQGFVTQTGYRDLFANGALRFYPSGLFRFLRAYAFAERTWQIGDGSLGHDYGVGFLGTGSRNLNAQAELHHQQVRVGDRLLTQRYLFLFGQVDPGRRWPRVGFSLNLGEQVDFANGQVGHGPNLYLYTQIRPTDHLEFQVDARRSWVDVRGQRLFTARVERLKTTYVFNRRALLRLIGQYVRTDSDPTLYPFDVPAKEGGFSSSALFSYKLNWQTVLFLGYGDERTLLEDSSLLRTSNAVFFKISYAIQR